MFDLLMELPLFRGVSHERIAEVVGAAKFHFLKYPADEIIVNAGEPCTHIKFIISGSIRVTIGNTDGRFSISHTLHSPDVIAPDFLFGRVTQYPCTVRALEPTSILQIAKSDYLKILDSDPIFLYNLLNLLSVNSQKSVQGVLSLTTGSTEERIAYWVVALTQPNGTDITIHCKQRDLYTLFGVPRQSFIAMLEGLRKRGLIDFNQSEVKVLDRRKMLTMLHSHIVVEDD
jgi:CRP-like cAMP-binding protein